MLKMIFLPIAFSLMALGTPQLAAKGARLAKDCCCCPACDCRTCDCCPPEGCPPGCCERR